MNYLDENGAGDCSSFSFFLFKSIDFSNIVLYSVVFWLCSLY